MIDAKESKHYEQIKTHAIEFQKCPYGRLGDVELRFGHSKSSAEAYDKWCIRKERVNYDNLIVKMSEHNGCTFDHLQQFDNLPYEKKFVFVTRDYGFNSQVIYKKYFGQPDIINGTNEFRDYINLENLIAGLPFKINQ